MIALMVAMDKNRVIGHKGSLPWHYKEDLQYFKEKTLNHPVIMGRKTYESILRSLGKPLPKRENIVLTRQDKTFKGARVIHDLPAYLETIPKEMTVFVIGGAEVFELALPYADRLYITHIDKAFEGDTYFPDVDLTGYNLIESQVKGDLRFAVYQRKGAPYDHSDV